MVGRSFVFLKHTVKEVDILLSTLKQYVHYQGDADREKLVGEARFAYTVVISNITLKLLHSKRWLDRMTVLSQGASEPYPLLMRVHSFVTEDEELYGYLPKILVQLSRASLCVYNRVNRLDKQIHEGTEFAYDGLIKEDEYYTNITPIVAQWQRPSSELGNVRYEA